MVYHIELSYEDILKHHKEESDLLFKELRNSKSKSSSTPLERIKWKYFFQLQPFDPMNYVRAILSGRNPRIPITLQEKIEDFLSRVNPVISLGMKAGRFKRTIDIPMSDLFREKIVTDLTNFHNQMEEELRNLRKRMDEDMENYDETGFPPGLAGFSVTPEGIRPLNPMEINSLLTGQPPEEKTVEYNIDDLLDKISKKGIDSLSVEEKKWLDEYSRTH